MFILKTATRALQPIKMVIIRACHIAVFLGLIFFSKSQSIHYKTLYKFTTENGLSSYNIHKIVQDKYQFLWVATQDGLNRFDGKQFVQYGKDKEVKRQLLASDVRDVPPDDIFI